MYTYRQVEDALLAVAGLDEAQRGSLRGQLKNYQTRGISPPSPSKTRRIAYQQIDVFKWAFCLELSEFGIDPKVIVKIFVVLWRYIEIDIPTMGREYHIVFYPTLRRIDLTNDYAELRSMLKPMCCVSRRGLIDFIGRDVVQDDQYDRRLAIIHVGGLWVRLTAALAAASNEPSLDLQGGAAEAEAEGA